MTTAGNDQRQVLSERTGVVEAPIVQVASLLAKSFGELTPRVRTVEVDPAGRTFAVQGGWWFRAECHLQPHPRGTLLVYRVLNVARTRRWMVPLVLLQYRLAGQLDGMYDVWPMIRDLGEQLACPAYAL